MPLVGTWIGLSVLGDVDDIPNYGKAFLRRDRCGESARGTDHTLYGRLAREEDTGLLFGKRLETGSAQIGVLLPGGCFFGSS